MHFNSILFSDFDFTLFEHKNPEVFKENLKAITKWRDAGNYFAIATGRGEDSLRSIFPDYKKYCDFCVLCDGGIIIDCNHDKLVYADRFGSELAQKLVSAIAGIDCEGDYAIICFSEEEEEKEFPVIKAGTCKIRFWFETREDCNRVADLLATEFADEIDFIPYYNVIFNDDIRLPWVSSSLHNIIEAGRKGTNKGTGVSKILEVLSVHNAERIITIGDDKNDISMVKKFNGYAVEHAAPEILSIVQIDHIVPHLHDLITERLS